jgi:hypothetical protein
MATADAPQPTLPARSENDEVGWKLYISKGVSGATEGESIADIGAGGPAALRVNSWSATARLVSIRRFTRLQSWRTQARFLGAWRPTP